MAILGSPTTVLRRIPAAALAALVALASLAAGEAADAKKKRKAKSAAGLYVGGFSGLPPRPTPKLTFRLNPDGTIVDFTLTNLPLTCFTEDYNVDTDPGIRDQLETLAAPPMSLGAALPRRGLPSGLRFSYEDPLPPPPPTSPPFPPLGGPPFRGIAVDGTTRESGRFRGRVNMAIFNDTRGAVGTEECNLHDLDETDYFTYDRGGEFDWFAVKKAGGKRKKKKK